MEKSIEVHRARRTSSAISVLAFLSFVLLPAHALAASVVVNSEFGAVAFDAKTGEFLGSFGSGATYGGVTFGHDHRVTWYSEYSNVIVQRACPTTSDTTAFEALPQTRDMAYGADGLLYTANPNYGIVRYDPRTNALVDVFIPFPYANSRAVHSFAFGPDGDLFLNIVTQGVASEVLRFDGSSGALLGTFIPMWTGGVAHIYDLRFGEDGNLYASVNPSASFAGPVGVARYDGVTGAFIDMFVSGSEVGLTNVTGLTFGADGTLFLLRSTIGSNPSAIWTFDQFGTFLGKLAVAGGDWGGSGYFMAYAPYRLQCGRYRN